METRRWVLCIHSLKLLFLVASTLLISGCNLPVGQNIPTKTPALVFPTSIPTSLPALVSATPILVSPTTTAADTATPLPLTAVPTNALPPTAALPTSQPNSTAILPTPKRINFAAGATAGIVQGNIQAGQALNFLVGAAKNQPLMISADSPNHDVTFSVLGLTDGQTLVDASSKLSSWQTMLTFTQDYLIKVSGGASTESFTLNVITPARINFDPGAISALRKGSTPGGLIVSYVVRASAGQQMDINLQATQGTAVLGIYGYQNGNPYMRSVVESTTFNMQLPVTQDYIIQVVPYAGQIADYILNITIQ